MPLCLPAEPEFPDERRAERVVWEALRDALPDDAVLVHSLPLLEGDHEHELDLLVAWPGVGLAVVEVKGGHVSRDRDGWWQSSRGERHHLRSPVLQAQDGKKVLVRYLQRHAAGAARSRAAHLVAFPFTPVPRDWEAPDCPRDLVVDRADLPRIGELVMAAVERHGAGHQPLGAQDVPRLVDLLAGQLPALPPLLVLAEEHEQRVEQMTREQLETLRHFRHHRRLCVVGGAGTGKTWLALEQARRLSAAGERVALLCYSRGLARLFERHAATWRPRERPAYVGLFHQLPVEWGARPGTDDSDDFEVRLPRELGELAATRPVADLFDAVVVDEAQDFGELWWPSVLKCLRDPERGGLFVFMDEAQRVFSRRGRVPIDIPPYALDECIRNTKNIAQLFSSLSDEPLRPRGLPGPAVRLVDVPVEQVVAAADDAVEALLGEGFEPGQVALLTTQHRHPEQRNAVEVGGWAAYWDAFFDEQDVFYGHVLGFKGLERPAVVLAVNGFRELDRAKEMLYVGLSRARTLLVVVAPRDLLEHVGGEGVRRRLDRAQRWDPAGPA